MLDIKPSYLKLNELKSVLKDRYFIIYICSGCELGVPNRALSEKIGLNVLQFINSIALEIKVGKQKYEAFLIPKSKPFIQKRRIIAQNSIPVDELQIDVFGKVRRFRLFQELRRFKVFVEEEEE